MPTEAMPVTALAVLMLLAAAVGIIGAMITVILLLTIYRARRDIRYARANARAIAKAKKEMKDRVRRLKEEQARREAHTDLYFEKYQEFVDGL